MDLLCGSLPYYFDADDSGVDMEGMYIMGGPLFGSYSGGGCCQPAVDARNASNTLEKAHIAAWYVQEDNAILKDDALVDQEDLDEQRQEVKILASENEDETSQVLTPSLMEALQGQLPICKQGESFWLKYSLVRDGASISTLLSNIRNMEHCIMAAETVDGEVFGSYTPSPWKISHNYYGSGESFLWRLEKSRPTNFTSGDWRERFQSDIEVFKFAFQNRHIQLCEHDRIVLGGGEKRGETEWGFGLVFEEDLLTGMSSPCLTFSSPSLSRLHSGSHFEVRNLEVWALTPCQSMAEAEKLGRRNKLDGGSPNKKKNAPTKKPLLESRQQNGRNPPAITKLKH
jgi:hypothetical protein